MPIMTIRTIPTTILRIIGLAMPTMTMTIIYNNHNGNDNNLANRQQ